MRHKKAGRQFGRDTSSRRAMFRNLAANLITHERIETTDAKAKELRRIAERLITKATRLGKVGYTAQTISIAPVPVPGANDFVLTYDSLDVQSIASLLLELEYVGSGQKHLVLCGKRGAHQGRPRGERRRSLGGSDFGQIRPHPNARQGPRNGYRSGGISRDRGRGSARGVPLLKVAAVHFSPEWALCVSLQAFRNLYTSKCKCV